MYRWADTVLVPADRNYAGVSHKLVAHSPWFDGCIGAIDGTHIKVEVTMKQILISSIGKAKQQLMFVP